MLRRVEVLCRMPVFGRITTTHMTAYQAHAQVNPRVTGLQALFAAVGVRLHVSDLIEMGTGLHNKESTPTRIGRPTSCCR